MVRSKRQLIGKLVNDEGDIVWVYEAGRDYWISHNGVEHLCHRSIQSVEDTKREALLVFHVNVQQFEYID